MPYMWVDPEELFIYEGKAIYHAYKNDDYSQRLFYWYSTDINGENEFDIRDLPQYEEDEDHEEIIIKAIKNGDIKFKEGS